ncbi:hypothetical protein J2129_002642 [Methanofollis sp. W23]|nr:hypothetical protein [Methanofollis sp. W23]
MVKRIGTRAFSMLLAVVLVSVTMVPLVSASDEKCEKTNIIGIDVPVPEPVVVPSDEKLQSLREKDDGVIIESTITYLTYWNEKMKWDLSEEEIKRYSQHLEEKVLVRYYDVDDGYYRIHDLDIFGKELGSVLGLNTEQTVAFVQTHREQLAKDHQNYHCDFFPPDNQIKHYISPSTRSAPYAHGKMYYLYIITNFQTQSSDGAWTTTHQDDALDDAYYGTHEIRQQAPSGANAVNEGGIYTVTVSGANTGDNSDAWGVNGWMEEAASNIGYSDSNGDGRTTDDMARSIKSWSGADTVILLYLTHDDMGGYAVGPDQGYADRTALSYWGKADWGRFNSVPGSYEHESLHLYGALDEYEAPGTFCGQSSILAVSPMHDMYTNTNHVSCSSSTNSVMRYLYNTSTISTSTRRFIGWGDYDNDGTLDPIDATPWG